MTCGRCGHAFDKHGDRAWVGCEGALRCYCLGWTNTRVEEDEDA